MKLLRETDPIAVAVLAIVLYYVFRIAFLFKATYTLPSFLLSLIVFLAETFLIIHGLGFLWGAFKLSGGRELEIPRAEVTDWPWVAVVIPVKNEPEEVLRQTLVTINALDYPALNVYLLDDSDQQEYVELNQKLVQEYAIHYFRPQNLKTAKAGAINEFLAIMQEPYIAVFDADQNPMPSFLKETVSVAESDNNIAFVQTPQFYANLGISPIAKAAAMQQSIFFESICEAKARSGAMFCCGTNVLLRSQALKKVGGFDQHSITEDFATSIKLHMAGYTSIYLNQVQVFGQAPETLAAYFKQQARWSSGTGQTLFGLVYHFIRHHQKLSTAQWAEYFLSGTYYFVGWAFLFFMICPIIWLLFGISAFTATPEVYLLTFVPYYFFSTGFFYLSMKKRNYGVKDAYYGSMLGFLSFPILIISSLKGVFNQRMAFVVTPKHARGNMSFWELWPWHLAIAINIFAIGAGGLMAAGQEFATVVNMSWCAYHVFLLTYIYQFNQRPNKAEIIA